VTSHHRWARLRVAVPLMAVALLALVVPQPAGAQPAPTISLVDQTTWVHPGERFDVRAQISGAPADSTLRLVVHKAPTSRDSFRRTLDGELGGVLFQGDRQPLAELPAGPGGTVTAGFVAGSGGLALQSRGVYPVEVQLLGSDGSVLASFVTYLTFLTDTDEFPPLSVAVVVDIAAPLALQPDGSWSLGGEAVDRAQERTDLLADTPGVALTVAPQPETIEALAVDGAQGEAEVESLRADAAARRPLARPYVDVDLAALQRAGLIGEANAQAEGGANIIRGRLATEPVGGVWMSGATFGGEAARLAVQLGLNHVLVPPSAIGGSHAENPTVPTAPVRLGENGPLAMVSDPELASHFTDGSGVLGAHRFVAELTIEWLEAPANPRAVVVHLPPDAQLDPAAAAVALNALRDGQAVQAVPLDQIFGTVPPGDDGPSTVTPAPHEVTDDLRPIAGSLGSAHARVNGLGGLVEDPLLASSLQQSLLVSTGTETPDEQRPAYVDRVDKALGAVSGAVTLPDRFRITLTSRSSTIPVSLDNQTNQKLTVRLTLDSDQLEFPEGRVLNPTLDPGTTRIEVPVRVRTSGAFTMDVTVTSPDGSIVLDTSTFDVRSTAISGVGLVLSIGAGVFLLVWWARHWRSARRSRHLMPASAYPHASGPPAGDGSGRPGGPGGPSGPDPGGGPGGPGRVPIPDHEYRPAHMAGQRGR
jgi:hypothetical protein